MLLVFSLFVMLLGHFTSPADCNDEQEDMVEDLHNGHGRKPKTESKKAPGWPEETSARHLPVPDHLLVVRVLQENLRQERWILEYWKASSPSRQACCPRHIGPLPFQASLLLPLQVFPSRSLGCRESSAHLEGYSGALLWDLGVKIWVLILKRCTLHLEGSLKCIPPSTMSHLRCPSPPVKGVSYM